MTNPLPPVEFEALPVPSSGYGLYSAATIFETGEVARELGGVNLQSYNCDTGYGTYSTALCDEDPEEKEPGLRGGTTQFDPLVVWAAAECATDQTEAEEMARARQIRTLREPLLVEAAFGERLLIDAGPPMVVATLADGIGMLEEFLGDQGYAGYIHAARRWAVKAGDLNAVLGTGPTRRTNLGNTWVFGGGYSESLGDILVATGPVYVWRSTPFEKVITTGSHSSGAFNNSVYALSERVVTVGYECAVMAVAIGEPEGLYPGGFPGVTVFPTTGE